MFEEALQVAEENLKVILRTRAYPSSGRVARIVEQIDQSSRQKPIR